MKEAPARATALPSTPAALPAVTLKAEAATVAVLANDVDAPPASVTVTVTVLAPVVK